MIELTKMDSRKMLLNEAVIETVEETPDTVIRLTTGNKYIVKESKQDIMEKIQAFQRAIRES
ncbi:MAG: flagellar FlbD family protein [Lachnospiraceae bacterium]|nr:flagellar FlbD family protein [Lachnospiraceae bacterium]